MGDHAARRFRAQVVRDGRHRPRWLLTGRSKRRRPPLRLAASEFSSNLSTRDVAALAKQGSVQPTNPRLSDIPRPLRRPSKSTPPASTQPTSRGKPLSNFEVLPSGTTSFDIGFEYANGQWRPVLTTTQSATGSASPCTGADRVWGCRIALLNLARPIGPCSFTCRDLTGWPPQHGSTSHPHRWIRAQPAGVNARPVSRSNAST